MRTGVQDPVKGGNSIHKTKHANKEINLVLEGVLGYKKDPQTRFPWCLPSVPAIPRTVHLETEGPALRDTFESTMMCEQ